ncbi:MAG: leucine-rich repeat domain-containing protein [Bacteroides sp.]|nr:leucine-rich repeat domain-containing protein [Bacteroides sp.]MBD5419454.1 leucine-rich repeat domain-containing protein [Bacteroides sp.]
MKFLNIFILGIAISVINTAMAQNTVVAYDDPEYIMGWDEDCVKNHMTTYRVEKNVILTLLGDEMYTSGIKVNLGGRILNFRIRSEEKLRGELFDDACWIDEIEGRTPDVLEIPEYVEYNGKSYEIIALNNTCLSVKKLVLPSTLRYLGPSSFSMGGVVDHYYKKGGYGIDFGNSLEIIDTLALEIVGARKLEFPSSLIEIRKKGVTNCRQLKELILNEGVSTIWQNNFTNCLELEELKLPHTLQGLGEGCFSNCPKLKKVDLGRFCSGSGCFNDCPAIEEITVRLKMPYGLKEGFDKVDRTTCVLKVPYGRTEYYRQAEGWKDFVNIVELPEEETGVSSIRNDHTSQHVIPIENGIYTISGIKVGAESALQKGQTYVEIKDGKPYKFIAE